jgi:hypothetical protein
LSCKEKKEEEADEGSLGILNQKIRDAVTLFLVQITRNEKRKGCPPVLKRKFFLF